MNFVTRLKSLFITIMLMSNAVLAQYSYNDNASEFQTWTSRRGTTISARFIRTDGKIVYFEQDDGKTVPIPFSGLSESDQSYIVQILDTGNKSRSEYVDFSDAAASAGLDALEINSPETEMTPPHVNSAEISLREDNRTRPLFTTSSDDMSLRMETAQRIATKYGINLDWKNSTIERLYNTEGRITYAKRIHDEYGILFNWRTTTVAQLRNVDWKITIAKRISAVTGIHIDWKRYSKEQLNDMALQSSVDRSISAPSVALARWADDKSFDEPYTPNIPPQEIAPPPDSLAIGYSSSSVDGTPDSIAVQPQSPQSVSDAFAILYGKKWGTILILNAILTYLIGLTPPFLIRYAFLKRAVKQWQAILLSILLFVFNLVIFSAMGSKHHGASVVMMFVSIGILSSGPVIKRTKQIPHRGNIDKLPHIKRTLDV